MTTNSQRTAAGGANLRRMNPIVAAAIVGVSGTVVGGTVVVGVAGFGASIWNTRRTIAHARESRVWDQRAAVYVDALAAVHYRNVRREYEMRTDPLDAEFRQHAKVLLATYKAPDFHDLEARLQAFGSEPVVTAMQLSSSAHDGTAGAFRTWQELSAMTGTTSESTRTMVRAVDMARRTADGADDAVVELIRTELQGRGKPLADWRPNAAQPPGAARRFFTGKAQPEDSAT